MLSNKPINIIMLLFVLVVPVSAEQMQLAKVLELKESGPIKSLNIGIFPRRNPRVTIKLFSPLAKYLEQSLNISVKVFSIALHYFILFYLCPPLSGWTPGSVELEINGLVKKKYL